MKDQTNVGSKIATLGLLSLIFAFNAALPPQSLPSDKSGLSESHSTTVPQEQPVRACLQAASFVLEEMMDNREVQNASYELFSEAKWGVDRVERTMWVTFRNGTFGFVRWPSSASTNTEVWRGPMPECTVAVIHTHPTNIPGEPSLMDHQLADGRQLTSVRLLVYVLHRKGIWKAEPGKPWPVVVRDFDWIDKFVSQRGEEKARNSVHRIRSSRGR